MDFIRTQVDPGEWSQTAEDGLLLTGHWQHWSRLGELQNSVLDPGVGTTAVRAIRAAGVLLTYKERRQRNKLTQAATTAPPSAFKSSF